MQQTGINKEMMEKFDGKGEVEFRKRPGTSGIDGHFFEINLLTLLKLRGESKTDGFFLAGNMAEIGAFDDVVFKYWHNKVEQKKSKIVFLQAKYTKEIRKGKLTIEKLIKKGDNFDLNKYFGDYLNIKQKFNTKSSDPVFNGNFEDLDCDFVLYTSVLLDEKFDFNRAVDLGQNNNSILFTNENGKAFKFKMDNGINGDVINILLNNAMEDHVTSLAKKIIKHVYSKSDYKNMMRDELFKVYHVFLAQKVIDVSKEKKVQINRNKSGKLKESEVEFREGKFRDDFLEGSNQDPYLEIFRKAVYECTKDEVLKKNTNSQLQMVNDEDIENLAKQVAALLESSKAPKISKDDITKDETTTKCISELVGSVLVLEGTSGHLKFAKRELLQGKTNKFFEELEQKIMENSLTKKNLGDYTFEIPDEVIKVKLQMQTIQLPVEFGNISPKLQNIVDLSNKVADFIGQCQSEKYVTIDKDIKAINKLVGNVLVLNDETGMLKLTEKEVEGDAKNFMEELRNAIRANGLNEEELKNYNFDIKGSSRLSFVCKFEEVAKDVGGFLDKLKIFTGQSSVKELDNIIQNEMKDFYKLTKDEVENIFLKIQNKMKIWWEENEKSVYRTKHDGFWEIPLRVDVRFNVKVPAHLFTGRVDELCDLHSRIQCSSENITVISQMTSISGLGGIGKTELARQYIHNHSQDYDNNCIWIDAESEVALIKSFHRLAGDKLGISTKNIEGKEKDIRCIVDEVYEFFAKRKSLFIFDNAEIYRATAKEKGIRDFLPHLPPGANKPFILITSRNQNWGDVKIFLLNVFTEGDSVEFIRKALNIKDRSQEKETKMLAEKLQRFPLALQQAVAYIKEADKEVKNINPKKGFIINDYLKEYEQKAKDLLDFPFPDDSSDFYTKTTFTTWKITTDKIKANKILGAQAAEILEIIAYFSPENIPTKMFLKGVNANERELGSTVGLLKQYSMVGLEQGMLNIHRLVQQVTRINLKDDNREEEVLGKTLKLITANILNL